MNEYPLALVTGAAHRLGRTFALTLARQGFAIVLHYFHSKTDAVSTAEEIRSLDVPVYPIQADLTNSSDIRSLYSKIDSFFGHGLKVLVNSAGIIKHGNLQTISLQNWDDMLGMNLRATFLVTQLAVERMGTGGIIVNITEAGVGKVWTGFPAYLVSKAGLDTLTRLQAKTYAPNIRVNAIAPGPVLPPPEMAADEWTKLVNRVPLKHPVTMEEISMALEFILKNGSVTGQTIVVDGGFSLI